MKKSLFAALIVFLFARASFACSAFCLVGQDRVVAGKSYDWFFGHGFGAVYTNPRGISRQTMIFDETPNPASWTSHYGSVTLTQFGRGAPISGMNEQGLIVELLQLGNARYNEDQIERPYVNESQWAQYQLDSFASVDEVLAHLQDLRIVGAYTGIHYFVADATGRSAVVEFLDGRSVAYSDASLPTPVLTNDPYARLLEYASQHPGPPPDDMFHRLSEVRFQRAKILVDQASVTPDAELVDLAWRTLDTVRLNGFALDAPLEPSQWNIVYDMKARKIQFRTREAHGIKEIDLARLDFSPGSSEKMVDMNLSISGDLAPYFHNYTFEENAALIRRNGLLFTLAGQRGKIRKGIEYGRCDQTLETPKGSAPDGRSHLPE